jgi:hypothetical protein
MDQEGDGHFEERLAALFDETLCTYAIAGGKFRMLEGGEVMPEAFFAPENAQDEDQRACLDVRSSLTAMRCSPQAAFRPTGEVQVS